MKRFIISPVFFAVIIAVQIGTGLAPPAAAAKVAQPPTSVPMAPAEPAKKAELFEILLTPSAPAALAEAPQTWWQALIFDVVFKAVVPIFVPVLAALLFWLMHKLGLKLELETLDKIAGQAADYAEQKGAEWLKEKGEKSKGSKKEEWAWELVESIDAKLKGKETARKKLRAMILAKIPDAEKKVADAGTAAKPKPTGES